MSYSEGRHCKGAALCVLACTGIRPSDVEAELEMNISHWQLPPPLIAPELCE